MVNEDKRSFKLFKDILSNSSCLFTGFSREGTERKTWVWGIQIGPCRTYTAGQKFI